MKNHFSARMGTKQAGIALLELIIYMGVLVAMLLAAGVFSYSGDQSKSTNILSVAKELGAAATRYNASTSMMPLAPVSLFDKSKNTDTDTFEGIDATSSWRGPYLNAFAAGTSGEYPLDPFVAGASATFAKTTTGLPSGASVGYEVAISGIPEEIVKQMVADCNGTDTGTALPADHSGGAKCIGTVDGTTGIGTVNYLFVAK